MRLLSVNDNRRRALMLIAALGLLLGLALAPDEASAEITNAAAGGAACQGDFFNPLSDPNWSQAFWPITIMGAQIGPNSNPPMMYEPPICICPSRLMGIPMPGIGITFWEPLYIAEVERSPGCMSSLGGMSVLGGGYQMMAAEQQSSESEGEVNNTRMQVHWYQYPVFAILEMFKELLCLNSSGFALAYLTELDPTWQNDLWGAVWSPEAKLFANPLAQMACSVDAIAASVAYPIDAMFWCLGTAGPLYPLTGNSQHLGSNQTSNMQLLGKFIGKGHRQMMLNATIGPGAQCFSHPSPLIVKSQYRIDPVQPIRVRTPPIYLGQSEYRWGLVPPANYATRESSVYMIWQGQQCCLRF